MRNLKKHILNLSVTLFIGASASLFSQQNYTAPSTSQQLNNSNTFSSPSSSTTTSKIGVINSRKCLEDSKLSKHERVTLEKMKNQMESVLKEKEKAIHEIENKLRDEDYMDSISDDLERELKHKKKVIIEEGMELNRQFADNLEMTNMKIIQGIVEAIAIASKEVVAEMNKQGQIIDLVLSNEACTYFAPSLDITDKVLSKMDALFDAAQKDLSAKK